MQETAMTESGAVGPPVDLNRADLETLATLPGIGPALAGRIIQFREEIRPFREAVEVTAVKGISERLYRQFADQVVVATPGRVAVRQASPIETAAPAGDGAEAPPEAIGAPEPMASIEVATALVPQPAPPAAAPAEPHQIDPAPPPTLAPVQLTRVTAPEEPRQAGPPPMPAAPTPIPAPALAGCWRHLLVMLLGAVGGALLALLILQSLNGTLDITNHPRLLQLADQVTGLERRDETLQEELGELRQRLNQFEALSGRVQEAEANIQSLDEALTELEGQVSGLEQEAAQTQATIEQIRAAADGFNSFLTGLRDLLQTVPNPSVPNPTPGRPGVVPATLTPVSPAMVTPAASVSLTDQATATRTPRPTRTPTSTPTLTPMPIATFTPSAAVEETPSAAQRTPGQGLGN